ncbi:MAG: proline--tRNA ligase [Desulfurococcales archaeon]|nr:proline--tRNA ligase [Desulfurococcales archaeon]
MNKVSRNKWRTEFSKWFDDVLENGEFYDYGRYPVKGMGIWMPYGFQLRRRIIELIRKELDETGHEEVLFPLLIPETLLRKEKEHIRGFEDEVYWVTHGGLEPLDIKLALRPTSETSITYMESLWIKSYKQLPKKYYQIVSIFRYETKSTRPMIRLREVTTFKEAHTVHASKEDADRQVQEAINIYKRIFDELGIPYVISRRPEWDKFAGALYTIAFDTIFPDGRVLQIGTAHNLGQNFPKTFDFKIQLEDESLDYPWQTSYGLSDRVVASVIAMHGDDRGAILPVNVAPIQVIIVPIPGRNIEFNRILEYSRKIKSLLSNEGLRVRIDDREELRPGAKFYYWETRGVPVRLEVGEKEVNNKTITMSRRDTGTKTTISYNELLEKIRETLEDIRENLSNRAWRFLREKIKRTSSLEEAKEYIVSKRGIVEVPWCGNERCAYEMMEYVDAKALGTPYPEKDKPIKEKCPICGKEAKHWLRMAKTY